MQNRPSGWMAVVLGALGVLTVVGIWEGMFRLDLIDSDILPPPSAVYEEAATMVRDGDTVLLWDVFHSTKRIMIAFAISVLIGVPLGMAMGIMPRFKAFFDPILSLLRPLPSMTWIPLTMIWLGIDDDQKIAIIFMGCFPSIVVYSIDATLRVDPNLIRAAENLGANRFQTLWHVVYPAALPSIFSGLKVGLAIAWTCVISSELVAAESGIGYRIFQAKEYFNIELVVLGMLCISVTVLILDLLFRLLEWFCLPWLRKEVGK